ncbi:MAG: hypothetical protein FWE06_03715 [Oscillospiraceae bacterium]|nr:hypothetical protein [Oscillospiraceae bacterium]
MKKRILSLALAMLMMFSLTGAMLTTGANGAISSITYIPNQIANFTIENIELFGGQIDEVAQGQSHTIRGIAPFIHNEGHEFYAWGIRMMNMETFQFEWIEFFYEGQVITLGQDEFAERHMITIMPVWVPENQNPPELANVCTITGQLPCNCDVFVCDVCGRGDCACCDDCNEFPCVCEPVFCPDCYWNPCICDVERTVWDYDARANANSWARDYIETAWDFNMLSSRVLQNNTWQAGISRLHIADIAARFIEHYTNMTINEFIDSLDDDDLYEIPDLYDIANLYEFDSDAYAMVRLGIFRGSQSYRWTGLQFRANDLITRQEASTLLGRLVSLFCGAIPSNITNEQLPFEENLPSWARNYIHFLYNQQPTRIMGNTCSQGGYLFRPLMTFPTQQMTIAVVRTLNTLCDFGNCECVIDVEPQTKTIYVIRETFGTTNTQAFENYQAMRNVFDNGNFATYTAVEVTWHSRFTDNSGNFVLENVWVGQEVWGWLAGSHVSAVWNGNEGASFDRGSKMVGGISNGWARNKAFGTEQALWDFIEGDENWAHENRSTGWGFRKFYLVNGIWTTGDSTWSGFDGDLIVSA